jgi:hypothetical protein
MHRELPPVCRMAMVQFFVALAFSGGSFLVAATLPRR